MCIRFRQCTFPRYIYTLVLLFVQVVGDFYLFTLLKFAIEHKQQQQQQQQLHKVSICSCV